MTPTQALQRVIVRMHYDPEFRHQVFSGTCPPDINQQQHALLCEQDPRAFGCDPDRPLRTLQALIEESPVSSWWAGLQRIRAFFQSPDFHRAIMQRQRLIAVYLDWLSPLCPDFCCIEAAIAQARRREFSSAPKGATHITLGRGCALLQIRPGALEEYQKLLERIGADILDSLTNRPRVQKSPPQTKKPGQQPLIVQSQQIGGCNDALYALLQEFQDPLPLAELPALYRRHGLSSPEGTELLQELQDDGLLQLICPESLLF